MVEKKELCNRVEVENIVCHWRKKKKSGACTDPLCHRLYKYTNNKSQGERSVDALLAENARYNFERRRTSR